MIETPQPLTREGMFAYFDQMTDENGFIHTTADWLADVGMLIVYEATKPTQAAILLLHEGMASTGTGALHYQKMSEAVEILTSLANKTGE